MMIKLPLIVPVLAMSAPLFVFACDVNDSAGRSGNDISCSKLSNFELYFTDWSVLTRIAHSVDRLKAHAKIKVFSACERDVAELREMIHSANAVEHYFFPDEMDHRFVFTSDDIFMDGEFYRGDRFMICEDSKRKCWENTSDLQSNISAFSSLLHQRESSEVEVID